MRRLLTLSSAAVLAATLLLAAPAPTRAGAAFDVDLRRIHVGATAASAPRASGADAKLTLDPELQQSAVRLLARARPMAGAVVAVDVQSGRVLAFADVVPKGGRSGDVLLDTLAPAASLFKIVTSVALIEKGGVRPKQVVCIDGGIRRIERRHLEAPRTGSALCAPFRDALGHSRNAVYAQLVTRHLMRDDLISTAERFGFNQPLAFDGARIALGTSSVPFGDLDFARTSAGFRGNRLSVLGALQLAAVVANGGRRLPLRILDESPEPPAAPRVMHPATAAELVRMMEVTVHSGTSYDVFSDESGRAHLRGIRVAGKTGTLQPSSDAPTSSWFIGFAPSRKPRIAVSVLMQNGKVWRQRANEVGRDLLLDYFQR